MTEDGRPALTSELTGAELVRWYWLKQELVDFARGSGLRTSGGKELLTGRIAAALDGIPFDEPVAAASGARTQLTGPLTPATVIPRGQRCSQVVRAWFVEQVGPSFGFDAEMRAFFTAADGTQTMQDALEHYRATRGRRAGTIDPQFEFNRFTRTWHEAHPAGTREDALRAWRAYRERPEDERGRA